MRIGVSRDLLITTRRFVGSLDELAILGHRTDTQVDRTRPDAPTQVQLGPCGEPSESWLRTSPILMASHSSPFRRV